MRDSVTLHQELARLHGAWRAQLPRVLAELTALARTFVPDESARTMLTTLQQELHKLAGSGGSFGLPALSEAAREAESLVRAWLAQPLSDRSPADVRLLAERLAALERAVTAPAGVTMVETADAGGPAAGVGSRMPSVWLVDDDAQFAATLGERLASFGNSVRHFPSLEAAADAVARERPDLLLLDVLFPGQGDSTQVLSPEHPLLRVGCPVLFVSSAGDLASRVRALRLGAEGYVLKPVDVPRLAARITDILARRAAPPPRVMIVDDDLPLAAHYRLVLEAAGMEVTVLTDTHRVLDALAAVDPEILLLDVYMPQFSGPELAGVIRQHERWAGLPIVYLSADTDLDAQVAALARGGDDFLTKPIPDRRLVAVVRSRVERAREIAALISRDSLTGLLRHGAIKDALAAELAKARRSQTSLAVAMLDLDHFKSVNDRYGHASGDLVITALATLLRQRLRRSDLVGRYGGEEFVVLLPGCSAGDAVLLMEDIRERFAAITFDHPAGSFSVTVSVGVATSLAPPGADADALLAAADSALYDAKRAGRNRVQRAA